jgi:two-component system C4-dicarboxylate transport sensor histidine kinase DctB
VGHTLQPFVGAMLDELFLADSPEQAASMLRHAFTDRGLDIITLEGCLMYQGEPIKTVEMTLCHMQLPSSQKYLVTIHDMTERKRYEHEIKQASLILEQRVNERTYELQQANQRLRQEIQQHEDTQRELIQTAKLAVLGQLSAGINHELNQPLTAIRAFADNALTFLQRGNLAKVEGNLHQISQLGIHMGDIIARFKVFARKGDIRQGAVSVQHAIQVAAGIIESRLRENTIQLRLPVAEGLMIKGDMVFLEQVLVNLLANAVDAIVEADPQAMSPRQIHVAVHLAPDGRELTISVRDSGVGLSEQAQLHLFEPFFTSKSHSTGLGLGLSISQRIVELMGGRIYAQNHAQGGAEFCVVLQSMPVDAPKVGQSA